MTNEELLKVIKQAAKEGATRLYLSNEGVTELPHEMGQLTQLTKLYLGENKLTTLPPEIGQLSQLTELNLNKNQLTVLPSEMGLLINLKELTELWEELQLDDNPLISPPPEIVKQGTKAILAYLQAQLLERKNNAFPNS